MEVEFWDTAYGPRKSPIPDTVPKKPRFVSVVMGGSAQAFEIIT